MTTLLTESPTQQFFCSRRELSEFKGALNAGRSSREPRSAEFFVRVANFVNSRGPSKQGDRAESPARQSFFVRVANSLNSKGPSKQCSVRTNIIPPSLIIPPSTIIPPRTYPALLWKFCHVLPNTRLCMRRIDSSQHQSLITRETVSIV